MNGVILKKYFDKRIKNLSALFDELKSGDPEEVIHKIHVEIKKIRFVITVICRFNPREDLKKLYSPFKKVFKKAGKLRDLEIKQQLIKKYFFKNMHHEAAKELKKKEEELLKHFISKTPDYKKETDVKDPIHDALKKLPDIPNVKYIVDLKR